MTQSLVAYLDASAIVKLVSVEPETDALQAWLSRTGVRLTSRVGAVEVARSVTRAMGGAADDAVQAARARVAAVLDALLIVELTPAIADGAAALAPGDLRTLDAIHLATALEFRRQSHAFVTYDQRLAAAAGRHGLTVVVPA